MSLKGAIVYIRIEFESLLSENETFKVNRFRSKTKATEIQWHLYFVILFGHLQLQDIEIACYVVAGHKWPETCSASEFGNILDTFKRIVEWWLRRVESFRNFSERIGQLIQGDRCIITNIEYFSIKPFGVQ